MSRLRHLLLQLLACVGAWVFIAPAQHLAAWAVLQGLLAALLAIVLRQPGWQRLAHGLFVPAAVAMRQAGIPPGWYLLALLLTLALGRNALVERVPLYRSGRRVADRLAGLLAADAALLEAGCAPAGRRGWRWVAAVSGRKTGGAMTQSTCFFRPSPCLRYGASSCPKGGRAACSSAILSKCRTFSPTSAFRLADPCKKNY